MATDTPIKFIKQVRTGNYAKPYEETRITREEAVRFLGEDLVRDLEKEHQVIPLHKNTLYPVKDSDMYVGVEY